MPYVELLMIFQLIFHNEILYHAILSNQKTMFKLFEEWGENTAKYDNIQLGSLKFMK